MIGAFAVASKAAKFGYKRFGLPGAIAAGGVAVAGYVAVRRILNSSERPDDADTPTEETNDSAIGPV